MGAPAARLGDLITTTCVGHQTIGPLGVPVPAPPLPFSAAITVGVALSVLVGGRPAATVGCTGLNTPPHVGLHASDPFLAPPRQDAVILTGSMTVLAEGRPMATALSACKACIGLPAVVAATAVDVLVGP